MIRSLGTAPEHSKALRTAPPGRCRLVKQNSTYRCRDEHTTKQKLRRAIAVSSSTEPATRAHFGTSYITIVIHGKHCSSDRCGRHAALDVQLICIVKSAVSPVGELKTTKRTNHIFATEVSLA